MGAASTSFTSASVAGIRLHGSSSLLLISWSLFRAEIAAIMVSILPEDSMLELVANTVRSCEPSQDSATGLTLARSPVVASSVEAERLVVSGITAQAVREGAARARGADDQTSKVGRHV